MNRPAISFGPVERSPESRSFDVLIDGHHVGDAVAVLAFLGGNGEYLARVDYGPDVPTWAAGYESDTCSTLASESKRSIRADLLERWNDHQQHQAGA